MGGVFYQRDGFCIWKSCSTGDFNQWERRKYHSQLLHTLDLTQRNALELVKGYDVVTSKQINELVGFQSRTNVVLCNKWVEGGFWEIVNTSNKARKYKLAESYDVIVKEGLWPSTILILSAVMEKKVKYG